MQPADTTAAIAAHHAAVAMHRDNGDAKAARAAQARLNGVRAKVAKMTAEARRLADLRAWMREGGLA